MIQRHHELLTGWGNTAPSYAQVSLPSTQEQVERELKASQGPIIARGLGRSYGDAAQCAGGTVMSNRGLWSLAPVDPKTGLVEVGAGVSLDELLSIAIPAGWFVPVTPGTRQVTIGGAIAADIHGKNHHVDGSFASHVTSMTLATPLGTLEISAESDPDLFWATAGGMGLTGVVTHATIQMIPIETSYVRVDTERFNDLDAIMSAMVSGDDAYRYSVAWVDCMTTGPRMGRGVLTRGDHASKSQVEAIREDRRLVAPNASMLTVPFTPPSGLLNRLSIKAFNEAWYRKAPQRRDGEIQSLGTFFHPLDGVAWWNRLHGHRGFLQYQFVVDDAHGDVVRHAIDVLSAASVPSFLAVLKRFGPSDPGPLSFPMKGWTLALDIPIGPARLSKVLDDLDRAVAEAGGRIYLAKDSRLSPELLRTMYPDLGKLEAIRRKIDPDGLLASDLSRRLAL